VSRSVDRSGCRWFCGMTGKDIVEDPRPLGSGVRAGVNFLAGDRELREDTPRWCSARCRDLALPPLGSCVEALQDFVNDAVRQAYSACGIVPASPAKVPPVPGQRWELHCGCAVDLGGARQEAPFSEYFLLVTPVNCRASDGLLHTGWRPNSEKLYRYLGPTPTEAAPPAVPLPPPPGVAAGAGGAGVLPPKASMSSPSENSTLNRQGSSIQTQRDGGWCSRCGCGNDALGYAHLDTCRVAPTPAPKRKHPAGITCKRCLVTSAKGDAHLEACPVMRERGPSAVEGAPGRVRVDFSDLVDEFDLLPDVGVRR